MLQFRVLNINTKTNAKLLKYYLKVEQKSNADLLKINLKPNVDFLNTILNLASLIFN